MINYKGQLNLGNANFGTEKTITANEDVRTADSDALAREIVHLNPLINEQIAKAVLDNFCRAAAELMAMGFAVQLKSGDEVAMRIFPDIHVKGGNINLTRAKELDPSVTELTVENAGALIDRAGGVTCRVRAVCQQKFTELLNAEGTKVERSGVVEVPYIERKDLLNNDNDGTTGLGADTGESVSGGDDGDGDGGNDGTGGLDKD